jgi:hypothetical protein
LSKSDVISSIVPLQNPAESEIEQRSEWVWLVASIDDPLFAQ